MMTLRQRGARFEFEESATALEQYVRGASDAGAKSLIFVFLALLAAACDDETPHNFLDSAPKASKKVTMRACTHALSPGTWQATCGRLE